MGDSQFDVEFVQEMFCKVLCAIDGTMLSSSTAEAYLEMGELPFHETLHVGIDQSIDAFKEDIDFAIILQELDHFLVHTGELAVEFIFARIVDGAAIKDIAATVAGSISRNTLLVGKGIDFHFKTFVHSDFIELMHSGQGLEHF